ncbi:MAG: hypothetical protein ACPHER_04530, partial [Nevskiales bacterium]
MTEQQLKENVSLVNRLFEARKLVPGSGLLRDVSQLTSQTVHISRSAMPLVALLAHDRDVERDELVGAIDSIFDALYEHP